uniref:Uncharacterized protein n=1 Tax=Rhizophora mucronata TaxID=61149 RepID=A0A2P2IJN7_RHIMU
MRYLIFKWQCACPRQPSPAVFK